MPFVIGIPSSFLDEARNLSGTEDQLVFVLLDEGKVQLEGVDVSPTESMPPAALRRLDRRLHSLHSALPPRLGGSGVSAEQDEHSARFSRDVLLGFASFMASVFGHYRRYRPFSFFSISVVKRPAADLLPVDTRRYLKPLGSEERAASGGRRAVFDVDGFVRLDHEEDDGGGGVGGVSIGDVGPTRRFLAKFRGSQMFERFCRAQEEAGLRPLGDSNSEQAGDVFETLVRQALLRVGADDEGVEQQADGSPTRRSAPMVSDDQLSAAELRAKSQNATELFLSSGLISFWRVVARAVIRVGSARDSEKAGILEIGEIIKVLEQRRVDGAVRVRFARGWTSVKTSSGGRLLERLEV